MPTAETVKPGFRLLGVYCQVWELLRVRSQVAMNHGEWAQKCWMSYEVQGCVKLWKCCYEMKQNKIISFSVCSKTYLLISIYVDPYQNSK